MISHEQRRASVCSVVYLGYQKENIKACVTVPVNGGFPSPRAINAETLCMPWPRHVHIWNQSSVIFCPTNVHMAVCLRTITVIHFSNVITKCHLRMSCSLFPLGLCRSQVVTTVIGAYMWVCHKTSNIRRTLVGNTIVDHSDVLGALPVGAAPTTSSFSTWHLASRDSAKTTARQYDNLLKVGIWCDLYQRLDGNSLRPKQNGRHFAEEIFKQVFLYPYPF